MKRTLLIIVAIILLGGAGAFIVNRRNAATDTDGHSTSQNAGESATEDVAGPNQVIIKDFAFAPTKLTIKKGTAITWVNRDDARHDITPDMPHDAFTASKLLSAGETYQVTFDKAGTYSYHCSPHPYMKATIEVIE